MIDWPIRERARRLARALRMEGGGQGGAALPDDRTMVGPRLAERADGRRKKEDT